MITSLSPQIKHGNIISDSVLEAPVSFPLLCMVTATLGQQLNKSGMKFAHEYETALISEGFPDHWVQSAIAYRQLKKCIKKVEVELSDIGLDASTLKRLWKSINDSHNNGGPFQYKLEGLL